MKKVLYIYAVQDKKSFGGAMCDTALKAFKEAGYEVRTTHLYAQNFKAVASRSDFATVKDVNHFQYKDEQAHAYKNDGLSPDIVAEMEKVDWADLIVFQFPLWWFSMPAIMKGWAERVIVNGFAYSGSQMYDNGPLAGKKAMLAFTTSAPENTYKPNGLNGDINTLVWPIHKGMLHFTGLDVLPPFAAYAVEFVGDDARKQYLADYAKRIGNLHKDEPIFFHPFSDFDDETLLFKDGVKAKTPAHKNTDN